ncbi:MAG: sialate O-acetylesterase [Thermoguttaceae bacterium]|nr:sialate O-acetylesterase [Thermoguttaceae bacterium]MDW8078326.1 sialate O-acetylesterase [Thermoguttaceae bacterium]
MSHLRMLPRQALYVWTVTVLASVVIYVAPAWADVRLPKIFGSHMVIQQQRPVKVWGWADPGEKVEVSFAGQSRSVVADSEGRWLVVLDPVSAGGPQSLVVAGKNRIQLEDVLVGEVWVGSGQSNMQWPVSRSMNAEKEIAEANWPKIRLFTVARKIAATPQEDCEGQWVVCTPQTIADFSAVLYFFGRKLHQELDVPVGLINSSWGGTMAEAWTSREALQTDPDFAPILERGANFDPKSPHQPAVLFNAMIHPLLNFAIRGVVWYQGESNCARAEQYQKLFPTLIQDWRKRWGLGDFPFYFVQLAPFRYRNADPRNAAELREAQRLTLRLPNTGMVVTTDIGDVNDIHPTNKQEVGRRLALWALAKTYGQDVVYSGPLYREAKIEGNKVRLFFDHVDGGLVAKGGELTHFQVAGADGEFRPAKAVIDGETVVVWSDEVPQPVGVRFGWSDDAEPNLFNAVGLPASPFRTDNFPLVTAGRR